MQRQRFRPRGNSIAHLAGLLLFGALLAGCGAPLNQEPAPPTAPPHLPFAATAEPSPFVAAPPRLPTPHLPMATPYATPRPQAGLFEDRELGLTLDYPFYWNRSSGAVPGTLVQLANQADNVFVFVIRSPLPAGATLEQAARDMHGRVAEWLGMRDTLRSQAATRADGSAAWASEYSRTYADYNLTVRSTALSMAHGPLLITLASYGEDQPFTTERQTVEDIFASVRLAEPQIYGIPRSQAFVYAGREAANPRDYDPATGPGDRKVFSGLVTFDPHLAIQPDLAESWEISSDGTVYTFYLRRNARFHDGRPLTAQDVVYSWERAADPATGSQSVLTYLGDMAGAAAKRRGAAATISGLQALDDYTLQVTLVAPRPYFLMKLTAGPALVVDQANVESGPEWYRTPNGAGPYRLIRWEPAKAAIYQRNADFYLEPPQVPYLIARFDVGWNGLRMYTMGELDQVGLESYELAYIRNTDEPFQADLQAAARICTSFVSFDITRPPFDDPKVRQAFALAVDRQRYQERVLQGTSLPARGLYPPALPGYSPDFAGAPFDPHLARQRLAESRYGGAAELPPVTLSSSGYGFSVEPGIGVLVQMWQETLGVQISIEKLEPARYDAMVQSSERGNLFFWGWCADYPDPENFADALFHSQAPQNIGRYASADLDALLEQARAETDVARRLELYRRAEQIIVDDAAAIFLDHRIDYMLLSPRFQGFAPTPLAAPLERYLTFEAGP